MATCPTVTAHVGFRKSHMYWNLRPHVRMLRCTTMKGTTIFWLAVLVLVVGGIGGSIYMQHLPGKLDSFTQCLVQKDVKMYGAFWCPHCQRTKQQFGNSAKLLPYVECSTPDTKSQTQVCIDKKIIQYPTWTRPQDEQRISGEHTLQEIADFSGCMLPH